MVLKRVTLATIILIGVSVLAACGGGGGGTDTTPGVVTEPTPTTPATAAKPTSATVKLSTQGTLATGTLIGGIDLTFPLPAGVTVKATPDASNPAIQIADKDAVLVSGVSGGANTTMLATYVPAGATPGKLSIKIVNPNGFATGEFVTLKCDIAAGSSPTNADLSQATMAVADLNGAAITGLTITYSIEMK